MVEGLLLRWLIWDCASFENLKLTCPRHFIDDKWTTKPSDDTTYLLEPANFQNLDIIILKIAKNLANILEKLADV
jgi:hypothetical protein